MQRLIKLCEWVDSREEYYQTRSSSLFYTFGTYMNDDDAYCEYTCEMMEAIDLLNDLQIELRNIRDEMLEHCKFEGSVGLSHRYACKDHKEVFLETAPTNSSKTLRKRKR